MKQIEQKYLKIYEKAILISGFIKQYKQFNFIFESKNIKSIHIYY